MRRIALALILLIALLVAGVAIARLTARTIAGIPCDVSEQVAYHVHAHLTIVDRGRLLNDPPANVGIHPEHLCLYWLHTHDASGIIHIEAPHRIVPTLGMFFDIWGQPLSRRQVGPLTAGRGQALRVYVGHIRYRGNPRSIRLYNHTAITIEVGPPYIPPPPANFLGY